MMKVLFWMNTGFQTTSRHLLISILQELCKAGHSVTVLKRMIDGEQEDFPEELSGLDIKCVSIRMKASSKNDLVRRFFADLVYIIRCRKALGKKYDSVFVQSTNVAGVAFRLLKKKERQAITTLNVQDAFPENAVFGGKLKKRSISYLILKRMQKYAYEQSDNIITISEDIKNLLSGYGIDKNKIRVVYNWSYQDETYDFVQDDDRMVSSIFKKGFFQVVYAGNIGVMQNVDLIIEAARILKNHDDIWFYIIGDGVYKQKLIEKANTYGINNITFLPMQSSELAPLIYANANINIIPLMKNVYMTALPSKTATCLAVKKPIVFAIGKSSKFGKIVMKKTGCPVVESDDAKQLSDTIVSIKNGNVCIETSLFYYENMSKSINSRKYAEIITGRG